MSQETNKPQSDQPDRYPIEPETDFDIKAVHGAILREKSEPTDSYAPIPLWMVSLIMLMVFWGGGYLAFYSGGFKSTVFNPTQVAWGAAPGGADKAQAADPMVLGKKLFTANCAACHQATGQGLPGAFPPLAGSEWVVGGDWHGDNHLVKLVLHGLQGPIQAEGKDFNGAMPAWQQLKDEQIAMILTYIRNEWGNKASAITAQQVADIRKETAAQATPYTMEQLKAIPAVHFESNAAPAPEGEAPAPAAAEAPKS